MALSVLAGNAKLKEQLQPRLSGGLGHAYILSGPAGSGKHTLAAILSRALVCSGNGVRPCGCCSDCKKALSGIHPDIITISHLPDKKAINVDQVRQMRADAHIRPNEAARKVYILEEADLMQEEGQNAMLKLLEDGPSYAAFLLLTENAGGLLTTIHSRCEQLPLSPVSLGEVRAWVDKHFPDQAPDLRQQAAMDSQGIIGRAVRLLGDESEQLRELEVQARKLAADWLAGNEAAMMAHFIPLDAKKFDRQYFADLVARLRVELCAQLPRHPDRRRVMRAIDLTEQLQQAMAVNVNPGHLAGWLCAEAGMP